MNGIDPRLLAAVDSDPALGRLLSTLFGTGSGPELPPNVPGATKANPILLEPVTVNARRMGPVVADAANQVSPPRSMHGMPFITGMQAQQRGEVPEPQRVFARRGILPQMEAANVARAEALYEAIYPAAYTLNQPASIDPASTDTQSRAYRVARAVAGLPNSPRIRADHRREDAWRLYLGLPQRAGTFAVSRFRPGDSREAGAIYLSIPSFLRDFSVREGLEPDQAVKFLVDWVDNSSKDKLIKNNRAFMPDTWSSVMGTFVLSKGQDERGHYLSYYDKWDLNPREGVPGAEGRLATAMANSVGRPFEIYDRIYYDPKTFQPIRPQVRRSRR